MKKIMVLLCLFSTISYTHAQIKNDDDSTKIHQCLTKFFDGFSALDTTLVKAYITQNFTLLEDGVVYNMDSIVVNFNKMKSQLMGASLSRVNSFDFIRTEVKGNTAWVAYNNIAEITINNTKKMKLKWLESAFLLKEGNDWKISMLHSTMLKPQNE